MIQGFYRLIEMGAQASDMPFLPGLAHELGISVGYLKATVQLLDHENTVPFIVRYRQEVTGGLGEAQLHAVMRALKSHAALEARRQTVLRLVKASVPSLDAASLSAIMLASTLEALEDVYLPFKRERKGLAATAREMGVGALAETVWRHHMTDAELRYKLDATGIADAQLRVGHIISEKVSENIAIRSALRSRFWENATLSVVATKTRGVSSGKKTINPPTEDTAHTPDYTSLTGLQRRAKELGAHQVLGINRGETAKGLKITVVFPSSHGKQLTKQLALPPRRGLRGDLLDKACDDAYDRLLVPSLARELRRRLTARAEDEAVDVFASNLRRLLLQRPVRAVILGIDPGFRSGNGSATTQQHTHHAPLARTRNAYTRPPMHMRRGSGA